ncbi:MAG: hypothetical protein GY861_12660 [bacterium]|nr:hypothetical protein [bacterium]
MDDFYVTKRPSDEEIHTIYTAKKKVYLVGFMASNTSDKNELAYELYIAPEGAKYSGHNNIIKEDSLWAYDYSSSLYTVPLLPGTRIGVRSLSASNIIFLAYGWRSVG